MASDHDTAYKQLFAHPEIVRELLQAYAPAGLLRQLDLATLERVNGSYVGDEGAQRHSDMVWKVRLDEVWVYLYVLLEFQSQPDKWMALRMFTYVGLLYQDLVKRHELPASGMLPPVLPIVLYDGVAAWNVASSLADLMPPALDGLVSLEPAMAYILIDRQRQRPDFLSGNLIQLLFSLAAIRSKRGLSLELGRLADCLDDERYATLRRSVNFWLRSGLHARCHTANMDTSEKQREGNEMMPTVDEFVESWAYDACLGEAQRCLRKGLVSRFGSAGEARLPLVDEAGLAEARRWLDRLLEQKSLEEIFDRE